MFKIGSVEKRIYSIREEAPLIIPQLDPEKQSIESSLKICDFLEGLGVQHIALGSSLVNPDSLQRLVDVIMADYDFSITTYVSNTSSFLLKGKKDRLAIYWASVFNAQNMFFLRDSLVLGSLMIDLNFIEPIPTAYVFDDRGSKGTANWLSQPNVIPLDKPEISLSNALACQYLGMRFYIMAGGSNSLLPPSVNHVSLLKNKTDLFLIPTSGIKTKNVVLDLLGAGADALHIGTLIESPNGLEKFGKIFNLSKKFPGKKFI
jgi:phosphoglycerol geranylgeranyltransferase